MVIRPDAENASIPGAAAITVIVANGQRFMVGLITPTRGQRSSPAGGVLFRGG